MHPLRLNDAEKDETEYVDDPTRLPSIGNRATLTSEINATIDDDVIPIVSVGHIVMVARSQVRWVKANGDYVQLHTMKHSHLLRQSLASLEARWSEHGFMRIHRSFMIFIPLVTQLRRSYSGWVVRLDAGAGAVDLPVSRRELRKFKQRWMHEYRHGNLAPRAGLTLGAVIVAVVMCTDGSVALAGGRHT
jgi:DNA-binding LytR/AlgR family response regulator